jgi:hypothetical protein
LFGRFFATDSRSFVTAVGDMFRQHLRLRVLLVMELDDNTTAARTLAIRRKTQPCPRVYIVPLRPAAEAKAQQMHYPVSV